MNISELAEELREKKISFSDQAKYELNVCIDAVKEIADITQNALKEDDPAMAAMVEPLESVVDALTEELKARHIKRVQNGGCTLELGFIFNDCLNNLERVADHCSNIAFNVMEGEDSELQSHAYYRSLTKSSREEYKSQEKAFAKKYFDRLSAV